MRFQSHLATNLCRLEAEHGDPLAAFDYFTVAIGNYHDSGNTYLIRAPLGFLPRFSTGSDGTSRRPLSPGSPFSSPVAAVPAMAEVGTAIAHLRVSSVT